MNKTILMILAAAMPLCAQEVTPTDTQAPAPAPAAPAPADTDAAAPASGKAGDFRGPRGKRGQRPYGRFMERFDTNKDGKLDDQEREAMKAERQQRRAERQQDGAAGGPRPGCRPEGKRRGPSPRMMEKFDTNKDGKLDDQEREAMKAERQQRRAERQQDGAGGPRPGCRPEGKRRGPSPRMMEKFDTNKDGKLDDQEREAMRAGRAARRAERQQNGAGAPCPGACPTNGSDAGQAPEAPQAPEV